MPFPGEFAPPLERILDGSDVSLLLGQLFISCVGMPALFYGGIIVGVEVGGRIAGYPGRGIELHEAIVRSVKGYFTSGKK